MLPEYTEHLIVGLIASIGQLTESLVKSAKKYEMQNWVNLSPFQTKYSSETLANFLREHPEHTERICVAVVDVFQKNILNDRITCPLLNFVNIMIGSSCIDDIVLDPSNNFSCEIYRLTKLEIKGHKKLSKLISSINVFCQLLQVSVQLHISVLSLLTLIFNYVTRRYPV